METEKENLFRLPLLFYMHSYHDNNSNLTSYTIVVEGHVCVCVATSFYKVIATLGIIKI